MQPNLYTGPLSTIVLVADHIYAKMRDHGINGVEELYDLLEASEGSEEYSLMEHVLRFLEAFREGRYVEVGKMLAAPETAVRLYEALVRIDDIFYKHVARRVDWLASMGDASLERGSYTDSVMFHVEALRLHVMPRLGFKPSFGEILKYLREAGSPSVAKTVDKLLDLLGSDLDQCFPRRSCFVAVSDRNVAILVRDLFQGFRDSGLAGELVRGRFLSMVESEIFSRIAARLLGIEDVPVLLDESKLNVANFVGRSEGSWVFLYDNTSSIISSIARKLPGIAVPVFREPSGQLSLEDVWLDDHKAALLERYRETLAKAPLFLIHRALKHVRGVVRHGFGPVLRIIDGEPYVEVVGSGDRVRASTLAEKATSFWIRSSIKATSFEELEKVERKIGFYLLAKVLGF